jgi:hypothetical protein
MPPNAPRQPVISVGRLKKVLAEVPDDHSLVPSQVYELHWWATEAGDDPLAPRRVVL